MKRNYKIIAVLIVAMLILLVGFGQLFGQENLIVGVIFSLALIHINRQDMPYHPFKIGAAMLGIALVLGAITWFLDFNIYIAVITTFIIVFLATYYLFGDFQSSLFLPVIIGYLYLFSASDVATRVDYRFEALVAGTVVVTLALWLIAYIKTRQSIGNLLNELILEVAHHATATAGSSEIEFVPAPIEDILEHISEINRRLYRQPVRTHDMSAITEMRISLVLTLERLVIALEDLRTSHMPSLVERQALADLAALLEAIGESSSGLEEWRKIEPQIEKFITDYRADVDADDVDASPVLFELIGAVVVLTRQIDTLRRLWAQDEVEQTEVSDMFWARELRKIVRPFTLRLTFALKMAITLSILVGISYYVPWPQFTWLIWTFAFLMRPYVEDTEQRSITRIGATVVGIIVFTLLFMLTENHTLLLSIGVLLQILSFLLPPNTYLQLSVATTSALALVAIATTEAGLVLSAERLIFVAIGALIALVVTRFIYPYRVSIASVDLVERSRHLSYLMLKKVLDMRLTYEESNEYARLDTQAKHNIKGTALAVNIMEHQLILNSQIREYEQVQEFVRIQHRLINDIYFYYAIFPELPELHDEIDSIMHKLLKLITQVDDELVREEGRHTRYGGPTFYARQEEFLHHLKKLQRRINSTYAFIEDDDSRLSLDALNDIIEKLTSPFNYDWVISNLR